MFYMCFTEHLQPRDVKVWRMSKDRTSVVEKILRYDDVQYTAGSLYDSRIIEAVVCSCLVLTIDYLYMSRAFQGPTVLPLAAQ